MEDSVVPATTTEPPPTALADLPDGTPGYELDVTALGEPARRRLVNPIPVGRAGSVVVTLLPPNERITVVLDAEVTEASADGSSQAVVLRVESVDAIDADLTLGLEQTVGASAVVERDSRGAVLSLTVDVPDRIGMRADAIARQVLMAPFMLASPLPDEAVGEGGAWTLITRDEAGESTRRDNVVDELSPTEHTITVMLDGGRGTVVGGPDDLFPARQDLVVGETQISAEFTARN